MLLVTGSMIAGTIGYRYFEGLPWRDAFLHAAVLLGGMGLVQIPQTPGGKVFAGVFALYAGVAFVAAIGIVLAPVVHRVLHRFHWDDTSRR